MRFLKKLRRNEEGATAIEYGLIAALIAVAAIAAMQGLGDQLSGTFTTATDKMKEGTDKADSGSGTTPTTPT
ncbi:pilus assembly protein Flp/PilA [Novosphingobium sp. PhB55]|uniref:Flp family type IVb pilin n=1 Tax=Novosphingobium sp. PhB55 TaxID=2485106 RepID=UPI0010666391|nr:Flp family type IVb pilin [Novosphingobium sp. PhB55]TDW59258.1 pilus assembly protein Flp/PilA [Novosphingobium sp. PhB55]